MKCSVLYNTVHEALRNNIYFLYINHEKLKSLKPQQAYSTKPLYPQGSNWLVGLSVYGTLGHNTHITTLIKKRNVCLHECHDGLMIDLACVWELFVICR